MAELAPAPTFLIVGIAGNATRWLRSNLDKHPAIYAPPIDTRFFADEDRLAALGHRWYREQFADWRGQPITGECSPSYMQWSNRPIAVADRIRRHLPDIRLIAIVGDPFERFLNAIARNIRWGLLPADLDLDLMFETEAPDVLEEHVELGFAEISASVQGLALAPYAERFGDQLQVVFHDDIVADPAAVHRSVLAHIGADPDVIPEDIAAVRFDDRAAVGIARPGLGVHQGLYAWWRHDVEQLATLTGRDLSAWDPGVNPDIPTAEELMREMLTAASAAADDGGHAT